MSKGVATVEEYLANVEIKHQPYFENLRQTILQNLPEGYEECLNYGMLGYVVPKSIYPAGYHCDTTLPLPFLGLASQKNNISFYHMGLYANEELLNWFVNEYPKHSKTKLDMGKSCIRFKKVDQIPLGLIGDLVGKLTVNKWIELYETVLKK